MLACVPIEPVTRLCPAISSACGGRGGGYAGMRVPCHVHPALRGAPCSLNPAFRTRVPQSQIHTPQPAPAPRVPNRAPCGPCLAPRVPSSGTGVSLRVFVSRVPHAPRRVLHLASRPPRLPCGRSVFVPRSLSHGASLEIRAFGGCMRPGLHACSRRPAWPSVAQGPLGLRNAAAVFDRRRKTGDSCKKGGL